MLKTSFTIVPIRRRPAALPAAAALFLALSPGCGGGSSSPSTPAPTPAPPPTTQTPPTTPTPTPDPEPAQPDTATYTFEQPQPLIGPRGATPLPKDVALHGELALILHSRDWMPFWEGRPDRPASDGLKTLAETGAVGAFLSEAEAEGAEVQARSLGQLLGLFLGQDPSIEVTIEKPCLSYAQQISPSSDWFVGWSTTCATDAEGRWLDTVTAEIIAFDAGTADGDPFKEKKTDTEPREPIAQLDLREHVVGLDAFPAVFQRITANRKTEE